MLNYKELENIYAKRAPIFNCNKTKKKTILIMLIFFILHKTSIKSKFSISNSIFNTNGNL